MAAVVYERHALTAHAAIRAHADANNLTGPLDTNHSGDTPRDPHSLRRRAIPLPNMENATPSIRRPATATARKQGISTDGSFQRAPRSPVSAPASIRPAIRTALLGGVISRSKTPSGAGTDPNDADRASCFAEGVNTLAHRYNALENYAFRTPDRWKPLITPSAN